MKGHRAAGRLSLGFSELVAHTGTQNFDFHCSGVQVRPGQSDHFRSAEASATSKQHHCPVADRKLFSKALDLFRGENVLLTKSLRRGPNPANGIESEPLISDGVVVQRRLNAFQFYFRTWSQEKRIQPFFDLHRSNCAESKMSPTRFNIALV